MVVSDDVGNAAAVRDVDAGERAVRFLGAGGTLVLTVEPAIVPEMIDAVLERSAADPAFAATVDAAVAHRPDGQGARRACWAESGADELPQPQRRCGRRARGRRC